MAWPIPKNVQKLFSFSLQLLEIGDTLQLTN